LFAFVRVFTHEPLHAVNPAAHAHWLFTHASFAPQVVPQSPQLFLSLVRSTQPPPHAARPWLQPAEHVPWLQTSPAGQRLPHAPQFCTLVASVSQTLPPPPPPIPPPAQDVWPSGHAHVPLTQLPPRAHVVPHFPQSFALVSVSTHAVWPMPTEHAVRPAAQPAAHTPFAHCWFAAQRMPQPPQFCALDDVSMHWLLQVVRPPPHAQTPATQFAPAPHTFLHVPQLEGSESVVVQPPEQLVSPALHVVPHAPSTHTCPFATSHVMPQPPQFFGSAATFVHTSLQSAPLL